MAAGSVSSTSGRSTGRRATAEIDSFRERVAGRDASARKGKLAQRLSELVDASGSCNSRWSWASISAIRPSSSPPASWTLSSVSRRRLKPCRRSRSCASTCDDARLVPELDLAAGVLEHDAQLGDEHAPKLLHELRLRQAQGERQAEVLDVVALDQPQLLAKRSISGGLPRARPKPYSALRRRERRASAFADLVVPLQAGASMARSRSTQARRTPCSRRG